MWCYNGVHWWHEECKVKDTAKRVNNYLKNYEKNKT